VLQQEAPLSDQLLEELDEKRRRAVDGIEANLREGEIAHTHESWSMPKQFAAHEQSVNIERVCDFGIDSIEGERIYLTDRAQQLLRFIGKVKRRDYEYRGGLDPADLERPEALGRWGDRRTWQRAYAQLLELQLVVVERAWDSERGRILDVQLARELMRLERRPRRAVKVGFYEPESYPQDIHTGAETAPSATRLSHHLSERAGLYDNPLPPSACPPPRADAPPRPPRTDGEETLRTAPPNGAAPAPVETAAGAPDGHGSSPQAAAVSLTNGDKRPRQQRGAHSLELLGTGAADPAALDGAGGRRLPAWWRRLLEHARIRGPAPPE
jgi:hypothetical protein